jgi:hypothetical protein
MLLDQRIGHRCRHPANSAVNDDLSSITCSSRNRSRTTQIAAFSLLHLTGFGKGSPPDLVRPTYSGVMSARWLIVLLTAAAFVATPLLISARPAGPSAISAAELASRIQQSGDRGWSGFVETAGTLQVPDSDSFATLVQLLGENTRLRVWWRNEDDWRVDRIRSTGETGLFRQGGSTIRWVFESETATYSPVSQIRLPDASDLLPPTFARSLLQGVRRNELSRLPTRRVAGIDRAGPSAHAAGAGQHGRPRRYLGRSWQWSAVAGGAVRRRRTTSHAHHDASRTLPGRAPGDGY